MDLGVGFVEILYSFCFSRRYGWGFGSNRVDGFSCPTVCWSVGYDDEDLKATE